MPYLPSDSSKKNFPRLVDKLNAEYHIALVGLASQERSLLLDMQAGKILLVVHLDQFDWER